MMTITGGVPDYNLLTPINPAPDAAASICQVIAHVIRDAAPGGSAVITLVLDNGLSGTGRDQEWLMTLRPAIARTGTPLRMLCLATREGTRQLD